MEGSHQTYTQLGHHFAEGVHLLGPEQVGEVAYHTRLLNILTRSVGERTLRVGVASCVCKKCAGRTLQSIGAATNSVLQIP